MPYSFDSEGRIAFDPRGFFAEVCTRPRELVNYGLLRMTPRTFPNYGQFCAFLGAFSAAVQVHPSAMVVRGSALLGFSPTPRADKAWKGFRTSGKLSDIDVAIVDAALFDRLDGEVRSWESRQHWPRPQSERWKPFASRERLRAESCVYDKILPHGVCQGHLDLVADFDTTPFLGRRHAVSCFVVRDWWSARLRWERDLRELMEKVGRNQVPHPEDLV